MISLRKIYNWIGIKYAPKGTACYAIDQGLRICGRFLFGRRVPADVINQLQKHPQTLAFWVSGGIGDHIIAMRFIRDFMLQVGDFPFDVYAQKPAIATWLIKAAGIKSFNTCYDETYAAYTFCLNKYPCVFRLFSFIDIKINQNFDALFGPERSSKIKAIEQRIKTYNNKIEILIAQHPKLDGYMGEVALRHGFNRMTLQQGIAGIAYGSDTMELHSDKEALDKFGLNQPYVTIHNGYDAEFRIAHAMMGGKSTKTYTHYNELVALLHKMRPDLRIVQIGAQTSEPILAVDVNLLNKTSLPECAEILRHSMLHIDGESGLVHLAACLGTKSCVIFGPTSVEFFGYNQNINIKPDFCGNCWWMTEDWLRSCPRGFSEPRCLSEQDPSHIVEIIFQALAEKEKSLVPGSAAS